MNYKKTLVTLTKNIMKKESIKQMLKRTIFFLFLLLVACGGTTGNITNQTEQTTVIEDPSPSFIIVQIDEVVILEDIGDVIGDNAEFQLFATMSDASDSVQLTYPGAGYYGLSIYDENIPPLNKFPLAFDENSIDGDAVYIYFMGVDSDETIPCWTFDKRGN